MDRNCKNCKLGGSGQAVPGCGPKKPKLLVISDYPNKKEVELGKPMTGQAGQLMRDALKNIVGLDDSEVFYDNVLRCGHDGKYGAAELSACKKWTHETLNTVDCSIVLVAGSLAFEQLLPQIIEQEQAKDPKFSLAKAHGSVYSYGSKHYLVTWNPTFISAHSVKKIVSGKGKDAVTKAWYPTGGVPALFIKDLKKLKALIEKEAHALV
jgi:uracil-DNA glycosylase family 4